MQPEISRRCLKCGAAVRAGARFCPQCGQEFRGAGQPQTHADAADAASAHGEVFGGASSEGIESLAARLSAELAGGGAQKRRDVEAERDSAPKARDVYIPAREDERTIKREGFD
ncbi:MAG TPA: zinc ribbon domain-containing protein, partial [Pyrinomonadaceae bacterium]|nr:zinc ribbon domain-containing protein [Pyrinomonadaceae bacterium]